MFKSMMRKELMETLPVVVIASFLYALTLLVDVLAYEFGWSREGTHYRGTWNSVLQSDMIHMLWMIFFGFAILLGLVQTLADSFQGTWGYLLHLPTGRRWMIVSKLLIGSGTYLGVTGLFLLGCLLIGYSRQTEVHPFRWSMISQYVQMTVMGAVLYMGTFLTGLRPARWYVSRLLPFAGTAILAWKILALPPKWVYGLAPLGMVCVMLVGLIVYTGNTRDYT